VLNATPSLWAGRGENQVQWALLQAAAGLVQACEDVERQLSEHSRSLMLVTSTPAACVK
jgi:hypothetical protein